MRIARSAGRLGATVALVAVSVASVAAGGVATAAPASTAGRDSNRATARPAQVAGAVKVFPEPGTRTISPGSQVSFRAAGLTSVPGLTVVGSVSGSHPGMWLRHSDGGGASFVPSAPFTPGETVTVTAPVPLAGVAGHTFTYGVAVPVHDAPLPPEDQLPPPEGALRAAPQTAQATPVAPIYDTGRPAAPTGASGPYASRPDLHPPAINTQVPGTTAPGLLFATASAAAPGSQTGPLIYDNSGQPVWFQPTAYSATDLHPIPNVQLAGYRGPALAYFQLSCPDCFWAGTWDFLDTHYQQVGSINPIGYQYSDEHELEVSPDGTKALFDIYNAISYDLSSVGGPSNGVVYEGVIQEVDLTTGAVTFEWHSLAPNADDPSRANVPLTDSYQPSADQPYDYIHVNSIEYDDDGNLLVSARHTSQVLKIEKSTGRVLWRFSGKDNQFTFTDGDGGDSFAHDVRRVSGTWNPATKTGEFSMYDNGVTRGPQYGRGVVWEVDEANHTAHVVRQWRHQPDLFGVIVGSNRPLGNGDRLISWGNTGFADEFAPDGSVVFRSQLAGGAWTYRTVREEWHGQPLTPPDVAFARPSAGSVSVAVSWNGATDVSAWQLSGGPDAVNLRVIQTVPKSSFETSFTAPVQATDAVFDVQAVNGAGQPLGQPWSPSAIQQRYLASPQLQATLGAPVGGELVWGGVHVQNYQNGVMYWTPQTGAHAVVGAILQHLSAIGGVGVTGLPVTDELGTPDGVGRFNHFANGYSIYWTPQTGAHEVHGAIRAEWAATGWERGPMGYPVTDETGTPDGVGRFNHFSKGGSVYWTPPTGAHEVHGAIRQLWASMGWERSWLGYPTSDEYTPVGGARQNNFQNGFIRWFTNGFIYAGH